VSTENQPGENNITGQEEIPKNNSEQQSQLSASTENQMPETSYVSGFDPERTLPPETLNIKHF